MVASYIPAPPPKDVAEARLIITRSLDNMSHDEIRALAKRIVKASTNVIIGGTSLNDSGYPSV